MITLMYEGTAARELCGIVLMDHREPGQVLQATAIENLIALDNMGAKTEDAVAESITTGLLPIYFNVAGGFPCGYKPEELGSFYDPEDEDSAMRTLLHVLGVLTVACKERHEKISQLEAENASLRLQVEQSKAVTLEVPSTTLTFRPLAASPKDENNKVPALRKRHSFS